MRRILVAVALAALANGGRAAAQTPAPAPAAEAESMGAGKGHGKMGHRMMMGEGMTGRGMMAGGMGMCPMMMGGADRVEVKNIEKGVTITLTASDAGAVKRLQKMAEAMRLMHEAESE